jgi:predicted transcriptional regulator
MKKIKSFNIFVNEGVRDSMTPRSKEDIKNKLNRLSVSNRIEKIFDTDDILDIYSAEEIKKLLDRAITSEDKLEKISSKKEILNLYTKDEIKGMLNELSPTERYGRINDFDLTHFLPRKK